jgi:hypothetical protein
MATTQELATDFMHAYPDSYNWVYGRILNETLACFGDAKSFSIKAVVWLEQDADGMEEWIVTNIFPVLKLAQWPAPHTKEMNDIIWNAVHNEWKE